MPVKRSPHAWTSILQGLIFLSFLTAILAAVFLVLAWLSGGLQLPAFLLRARTGNVPTKLIVDVQPPDASVTLDGRPFKNGDSLVPGVYEVKVAREGFYSVQETFRVHPNRENRFSIRLMPMVTVHQIAQYATAPGWDQDGNLYFLDASEGKIYRWAADKPLALVDTVPGTYQLIYSPSGAEAYALAMPGPESDSRLYSIDLHSGRAIDLQSATAVSLDADGKTIWGIAYDPSGARKPSWRLEPGRSPKFFSLQNPQWVLAGRRLAVDPSGQWLAIESPQGIGLWDLSSGNSLTTIEGASAPVWRAGSQATLAYVGADRSLNVARLDLDWKPSRLASGVEAPLASSADGSQIIFSRYDPFTGGTSFWAVDATTMGVRLLSEARTESGRLAEFSVSPDGKKIAFVNQKKILFLVALEP